MYANGEGVGCATQDFGGFALQDFVFNFSPPVYLNHVCRDTCVREIIPPRINTPEYPRYWKKKEKKKINLENGSINAKQLPTE